MRLNLRLSLLVLCAAILSFSSCKGDSNDNTTTTNETLKIILTQYVNNTVRLTYHHLADAAIDLETACSTLQTAKTQDNVKNATNIWIKARKYWEQSEAFLYGPATIRGIDPHIDSWPLDKTNLDNLLSNTSIMSKFNANYATANLNGGLLGFHAIEYVLFRDGAARKINDITDNELKYAVGVAGDLKLQCITLEAEWSGLTNITTEKQKILQEAEVSISDNYGDQIINAGETGSQYKSQTSALLEILQAEKGCRGIANEVGNTKITDPVNSGNVLDVESWYSWNSKTDFQDNIRGIYNSINGGIDETGKRNENLSILNYIMTLNTALATKLKDATTNAIGENGTTGLGTIIYPFRSHLSVAENKTAIAACNNLVSVIDEVCELIQKQQ